MSFGTNSIDKLDVNKCFPFISWETWVDVLLLWLNHYNDGIMGGMASQITNLTIVYSTFYSDEDQRKH